MVGTVPTTRNTRPISSGKMISAAFLMALCCYSLLMLSTLRNIEPIAQYLPDCPLASDESNGPLDSKTVQTNPSSISRKTTKIWHEMTPAQQKKALSKVIPYIKKLSDELRPKIRDYWQFHDRCEVVRLGSEIYGEKAICQFSVKPDEDCTFLSFGIEHSYTFDQALADGWKCRGFAADPTVSHPSILHPGVTYHNVAATSLAPAEPQNATYKEKWWTVSMPGTKKYLNVGHLNVLKLDCEGCEYALARDILMEDPDFFHHVDQVTGEFHVSKYWLGTNESLYYFGMLLKLLKEAGFRLQASFVGGCDDKYQTGCMKELEEMEYPWVCRTDVDARACHEYLFAKQ